MRNIIKAINYQIARDNFTYYAFLAGFGLVILHIFISINDSSFEYFNGIQYVATLGENSSTSIVIAVSILTARICGWDYTDKTINYEILTGHKRSQVYWGRVIPCVILNLFMVICLMVLPLLILTAINGWGEGMDPGGAAVRIALALFPAFRTICEIALLTFLLKNCYFGMIFGFLLTDVQVIIGMIIAEYTKTTITWQIANMNISELFVFNTKMGFIGGEDVTVYDTALEPSMIIGTIAASLIVGIACLIIGGIVFKKSDLK